MCSVYKLSNFFTKTVWLQFKTVAWELLIPVVYPNYIFHRDLFRVAIFTTATEISHKFSCGCIDTLSEEKACIRCAHGTGKGCMGEISVPLLLSKEQTLSEGDFPSLGYKHLNKGISKTLKKKKQVIITELRLQH